MNKIVINILRPPTGKHIITSLGIGLGVILVSLSFIIHLHISNIIVHENTKGNFLVVNKKINVLNTLFFASAKIKKKEIEKLIQENEIIDAGPVYSNQFDIKANIGGQIGLITDFFVESVPDKFIDYKSKKWKWEDKTDIVPIILSRDLYNLYNFSFASSQGLPQLSIGTIDKINITLTLTGNGKKASMNARIVGISDRINSILVPVHFLNYANNTFSANPNQSASRLILQVKNPSNPALKTILKKHKLMAKKDLFNIGKGLNIIQYIIYFIIFIGSTLILFTFFVNQLSLENLLLSKNDELIILIQLGYSPKSILNQFKYGLIKQYAFIISITTLFCYFSDQLITDVIDRFGYPTHSSAFTIGLGIGISISLLGLVYTVFTIKNKVYRTV